MRQTRSVTNHHNRRPVNLALRAFMAGFVVWGLGSSALPCRAESAWRPYAPPELVYAADLRHQITLPTAINVNTGTLRQLELLPGFDEDVALKVMRNRPFEGIQDFYRKMTGPDQKRIDRLIRQVQPKLRFQ